MKGLFKMVYGFVKKHPYITYGIIAIPSCFCTLTGLLAISEGYYENKEEESK